MIKSIELKNFQSHEQTKIAFSDNVNIIIGSSDCGKTAVLRALNWVVNNRPLGNSIRSKWGGDTSVRINIGEKEIEKFKNEKVNSYEIDHLKDEFDTFKAFDKEVPDEVKTLLNFSEINMQKQLDAPFLLSESAGEVQRILNRISHLDMIDTAMSNIERERRAVNSDVENTEAEITNCEKALERFQGLDVVRKEFENLKKMNALLIEKKALSVGLKKNIDFLEANEKSIKYFMRISGLSYVYESTSNNLVTFLHKKKLHEIFYLLIGKIQSNNRNTKALKSVASLSKDFELIDTNISSIQKIEDRKYHISSLIEELIENSESIIENKDELVELEKEFHSQFPDVCPLCGQETKK